MIARLSRILLAVALTVPLLLVAPVQSRIQAAPQEVNTWAGVSINVRYYPDGSYNPEPRFPEVSDEYVRDTLGMEWFDSWPTQSLRAGAIMVRSPAFWEISRRWDTSRNCHAFVGWVGDTYGYFDTSSAWGGGLPNDQRYVPGSSASRPNSTAATSYTASAHVVAPRNNVLDYVYTGYGSSEQNATKTYADPPYNQQFYQILHSIYDNRWTGTCSDNGTLSTFWIPVFATSWEDSPNQPIGYENRVEYSYNVEGYIPSVPPEAGRRNGEVPSVPGWSDTWQEMMAGKVSFGAWYAYVYFRVFDNGNTAPPFPFTIKPGMKLRWHQYNSQQSYMSVDGHLTDGGTLRDSGIVDQFAVNIHPNARGGYATGNWLWFEASLDPIANRALDYLMVAYDGGYNSGQFRAYFDNVMIGW